MDFQVEEAGIPTAVAKDLAKSILYYAGLVPAFSSQAMAKFSRSAETSAS